MKNKIVSVIGIILLVGVFSVCLITGIRDFFGNKYTYIDDDFVNRIADEGYVSVGTEYVPIEAVDMKHSINFIPTGTEHFYYICASDNETFILVRGKKNWVEEYDGEFLSDIMVSGKVRNTSSKVRDYVEEADRNLKEAGYEGNIESTFYIDTLSKKYGGYKLLAAFGGLFCAAAIIIFSRFSMDINIRKIFGFLAMASFILTCVMVIHICSMNSLL